jgi:hypothetical protein
MRQIDFDRAAFAAGAPVWGSCWGLQLTVVALGGSVRRKSSRTRAADRSGASRDGSKPGPPASRVSHPARRPLREAAEFEKDLSMPLFVAASLLAA